MKTGARGGDGVIPPKVLQAIADAQPPCFIYDASALRQRAEWAASLLDNYYFPVKACPEPGVIRAALAAGAGLDLCSEGDLEIALESGCAGDRWKFTSACANETLLRRLVGAGARLDADSLEQALLWGTCGGGACGLRITALGPNKLYGHKFGIAARDIAGTVRRLAASRVHVEGLHVHGQHANLTSAEFAAHLIENLRETDPGILRGCRYVNIGGSWPMRHGVVASPEELREAFTRLRGGLADLGFTGALQGEPGRWVSGPCGYWMAAVAAVKSYPGVDRRVVVLDTSTPVPCRPSLAAFAVLRQGCLLHGPGAITCDIFGAANTALDAIGLGIRLPAIAPGDLVVSLGQGAYTRSMIPRFNERERPTALTLGA